MLTSTAAVVDVVLSRLDAGPPFRGRPAHALQYVWESVYHRCCRMSPPLAGLDGLVGRLRSAYPRLAPFWDWLPARIRTKYRLVATGRSAKWAQDHLPALQQDLRQLTETLSLGSDCISSR
jgi:hypothetical protein